MLPRDERISYAVGFTGHGFGLAVLGHAPSGESDSGRRAVRYLRRRAGENGLNVLRMPAERVI